MTIRKARTVRWLVSSFVTLLFLNGISSYGIAKCPTRMGSIFSQDDFLVIARRGSTSKYPENTLPAFQEALNMDGANSLTVDLSLTKDKKVVLWHDWDPNKPSAMLRQEKGELLAKYKPSGPSVGEIRWRKKVSELTFAELKDHFGYEDKFTRIPANIEIPTFQDLMEWATQQKKLKLVFLKLRVPNDQGILALAILEEIRRSVGENNLDLNFKIIVLTPHKEVLSLIKKRFDEFQFSYDREVPSVGVINYHSFTTVPTAIDFHNKFASIGFPSHISYSDSSLLDPWLVYKFILTLDFRIRDNYKISTSNYIKIISWNFNEEKKIRCLINLGVDGIVTDNPKLLRSIAVDMGKN